MYDVILIKDRPNYVKEINRMTSDLWPEFMLHDPVSNAHWGKLFNVFSEFQFCLFDNDTLAGACNCIPFHWHKSLECLPEEGWDWVLKKGFIDKADSIKPNSLAGLQVVIAEKYRGKGISSLIVSEMKSIAQNHGLKYVIIPVRPTLKNMYPLIPIDKYISWVRPDGLPFDPWIRTHVRLGGKIIKACHKSMYIPGTIQEWESWAGMSFPDSGDYIVKGALVPIKIDYSKGIGEYIEPNVWIAHVATS